jgi:hypothetical protein
MQRKRPQLLKGKFDKHWKALPKEKKDVSTDILSGFRKLLNH